MRDRKLSVELTKPDESKEQEKREKQKAVETASTEFTQKLNELQQSIALLEVRFAEERTELQKKFNERFDPANSAFDKDALDTQRKMGQLSEEQEKALELIQSIHNDFSQAFNKSNDDLKLAFHQEYSKTLEKLSEFAKDPLDPKKQDDFKADLAAKDERIEKAKEVRHSDDRIQNIMKEANFYNTHQKLKAVLFILISPLLAFLPLIGVQQLYGAKSIRQMKKQEEAFLRTKEKSFTNIGEARTIASASDQLLKYSITLEPIPQDGKLKENVIYMKEQKSKYGEKLFSYSVLGPDGKEKRADIKEHELRRGTGSLNNDAGDGGGYKYRDITTLLPEILAITSKRNHTEPMKDSLKKFNETSTLLSEKRSTVGTLFQEKKSRGPEEKVESRSTHKPKG